ncbi:MAG: hypothetical protein HQL30_06375 [Candidatus Omnitrophica bacterium]|nr:hypothetical protein [Candidatus Omnitrophota bacterium]
MFRKFFVSIFFLFLIGFSGVYTPSSYSLEFDHIESLFDIRSSIASQGQVLPDSIRASAGNDVRILERIFELNTSALTTIEAYFRIFKVTFATKEGLTQATNKILNEWLAFVNNQCQFDIEYLKETLNEAKSEDTKRQIEISKRNIEKLANITKQGITENEDMLRKLTKE